MARPMQLKIERTLVKSRPEIQELVDRDPRLRGEAVEVALSERGFGTQVVIAAAPEAGLERADLERLLDELAEPQRRPFTAV
jgi:hypothetical protein